MMSLVQPPRRVEYARLKIAAEASTHSLHAQVENIRSTAHTLRTETLGKAVKAHPYIAVGIAAAGGFVAYQLVKARGLPLVTLSAIQSIGMQLYTALKDD